ncbi:serine protease [Pseudonocardiaceae bacterium YIM PH 21723]|nr:serine protease [Pseudonocardiaceae bacterium YIM PH 21723]
MAKTLLRLALAATLAAIGLTAVQHNAEIRPVVVGGQVADIKQTPWVGFLATADGKNDYCGGTLVTPTKVITAAHCLGEGAKVEAVVFGRQKHAATDGLIAKISKKWVHPKWNSQTIQNDLAVLTLAAPVTGYAPLPLVDGADAYKAGTPAVSLGWGLTSGNGKPSETLKKVDLPVLGDAGCRGYYTNYDPASMVCAGETAGQTTCTGDSGGPLAANGRLIGVVSFGESGCDGRKSSVFTRLNSYQAELKVQLS